MYRLGPRGSDSIQWLVLFQIEWDFRFSQVQNIYYLGDENEHITNDCSVIRAHGDVSNSWNW